MKLKKTNRILSTLIILENIYFLYFTFEILIQNGGTWGFGLLVLPISLSINFLILTAGLSFKEKFSKSLGLLIINGIGILWTTFWFYTFFIKHLLSR